MTPTRAGLWPVLLNTLLLATATAGDPIPVLIVDGQNNHDWKATTPSLKATLENGGGFRVDVASAVKPSEFRPDFARYGAIVLNYNGPAWPEETQQAFVEYVRAGGGVVVVHAADNSFPDWKEYNEIIGLGGWGGRTEKDGPYVRFRDGQIVHDPSPGRGGGHGRQHEFVVVARAPEHPILAGLPTEWKHAKDELYDRLRGPAKNLTILATAFSDPATGGTGEHEPMLMTIGFGAGRCFHTALGHGPLSMTGLGFQVTLRRGTEWAATGQVTLPADEGAALSNDEAVRRDPSAPFGRGWVALFDGESLDGWTQRNGSATYRIEDGAIIGRTNEGSPNSFLCSDREYDDFELRFEVKVDDALNSGVQIRSKTKDGPGGRVHGPQVEIATNGTAGFVYGEALGTGWLSQDRDDPAKKAAFRRGEWNQYRVLAEGQRIRTWINGVTVADLRDEKSGMATGFIGLQVHGIPRGKGPYEVRWRNLWLRELGRD